MDIEYKRLTEKDLDTFIHMRIDQLREEGATEEIDLKPALMDYYHRHMADGTFVSWLAFEGDKIINHSSIAMKRSLSSSLSRFSPIRFQQRLKMPLGYFVM